jgi:SprT protein
MSAGQYRQLLVRTRIVTRELRFNPTLLQRYGARFIAEVVPHECAHLVAFEVYGPGIRPHGQEWQTIMREVFGRVPRVRHSFEVERPPRRQYAYRCACPERIHSLSVIRHKRVQSGGSRYLCQSCRAELISVPDT